jgi:hypothetical protein
MTSLEGRATLTSSNAASIGIDPHSIAERGPADQDPGGGDPARVRDISGRPYG